MIEKNKAPEITENTLSIYLDFALISYKDVQYQNQANIQELLFGLAIKIDEFFCVLHMNYDN